MANLPTSIKNLNTLLGEQLTEGGGGGSSDFSTAEVTFIGPDSTPIPLSVPIIIDMPEEGYQCIDIFDGPFGGDDALVPLYKGKAVLEPNPSTSDFSATGDITIDSEEGIIVVTGDGTITYTPSEP